MACFAQLRDNVPSWISDVQQLSAHVHARRAEFAAETRKQAQPSRRSTNSLSAHSRQSSLRASSAKQGLKRILSRDTLRESTKRRRVQEPSPAPRGNSPVRVILYDGHTQKVLEQMVRQIWSAKSGIRSSRISSSMQTALRGRIRTRISTLKGVENKTSPTDPTAAIEVDDETPEDDILPDFRPVIRASRSKESPYDFIEGQLDTAQNLCETAAYRFLREGNCLDELDELVRTYELVLEASTTMAGPKAADEAVKEEETTATSKPDTACEEVTSKPPNVVADGGDGPDELNAAILEVDERSDASEVSIDISAFRMTRYGQRTLHPFTVTRAAR